ncbi:unnamed protein product [Orchesella dallaii]|uniref:Uncharacterized protein n=1 Tax=Orchesella dallaii TaxID=48710 RepID=A0ABP1S1X7_9HEXA
MDVNVDVSNVFDIIKLKGLQNRLEASSSSYLVNAYVSLGLTRLVGSFPEELETFTENPVINILHDIGTKYVETWFHIQYIRNEAKRVKREIREIDTLCGTSFSEGTPINGCKFNPSPKLEILKMFQRSLYENFKLIMECFKYSRKKNSAIKQFIQSMEDTFEGSKCKVRRKNTIRLDRKLWNMHEKFKKIVILLNEEQLLLPKMLGQLRRDATQNVALPDLLSCHMKLKEANAKLRRAEV